MVFYFTATGNSLYVAKQLDAAPMSIPQAIHGKDTAFRDGSIGVVCPIFGHEAPPMVKEFLKKCTFDTDYFYMVLTYGNRHGGAAELAQALCAQCGIRPAYINTVLMVDNFLPAFDMAEQVKLDKKVEAQIEAVKADIAARRRYIQPTTEADRAAHQAFLARSATPPEERWKNIYQVADGCVGCGICTRVCPAGCWTVRDGKAFCRGDDCQCCMACIHACPQKAIGMTIPDINPGARYRNEHIVLNEIIQANDQTARREA